MTVDACGRSSPGTSAIQTGSRSSHAPPTNPSPRANVTRSPPRARIASSSSGCGDHIEAIRSAPPSTSQTPPNSHPSAAQTAWARRSGGLRDARRLGQHARGGVLGHRPSLRPRALGDVADDHGRAREPPALVQRRDGVVDEGPRAVLADQGQGAPLSSLPVAQGLHRGRVRVRVAVSPGPPSGGTRSAAALA